MRPILKLLSTPSSALFICVAVLCPAINGLRAQAPLSPEADASISAQGAVVLEWKIGAADRALRAGLPGLAVIAYSELLDSSSLSEMRSAEVRISLAAAYISQRNYTKAKSALAEVPETSRGSVYWLYWGISDYGRGREVDAVTLSKVLKRIQLAELDSLHRPWYHLLRGLSAELSGKPEAMEAAWEKAVMAANTDVQAAFIRSLILRGKIQRTPANETLAAEIRAQLERLEGEAAYPYAREYAIILQNMGRSDEAVRVIDQQLNNTTVAYKSHEREQLRLLRALILGADSSGGRFALRELVRSGQNREVMEVALQLLARADAAVEELSDFLNEMISRAEPHPLLGQMYYMRSQLALSRGETAVAEADARYLLEQFPGLSQITNVYHLLAYAALQRDPPQYRTAADFLTQLRDQTQGKEQRQSLNVLIGDCYFLNRDYSNATDFYQAAFQLGGESRVGERLYLRLITAELRAGKIDAAIQHLDQGDFGNVVTVNERWQAEWNVVQALQSQGQVVVALERVRQLLASDSGLTVPTALDLRLRWLEARLRLMVEGLGEGLLEGVDALLTRIESFPEGALDEVDARLLTTEVLLLKADVLFRSGGVDSGVEVLERLRTGYAESSAAERSYMTESNYHASIGDFKAAQATLSELATLYAESSLAPQALFEAALYCERRGAGYFADAVRLHNDLAERYPDDDLVYAARLKQGDLLRQMNDFAGAQIVYETLIHSSPEHPRRYAAELSRAECMLALAKNNETQLKGVALSLERLMDVPNLPLDVQAEAAYKWGFALMQMDAATQASEVYLLAADRFLLNSSTVGKLNDTGRYWAARSMLDLGALLEKTGDLAEARRIYRKVVAYNLPGRNLAQSRADGLTAAE